MKLYGLLEKHNNSNHKKKKKKKKADWKLFPKATFFLLLKKSPEPFFACKYLLSYEIAHHYQVCVSKVIDEKSLYKTETGWYHCE